MIVEFLELVVKRKYFGEDNFRAFKIISQVEIIVII
jgi:hypothetical protein